MCVVCSRRALMFGATAALFSGPAISRAAGRRITCGFNRVEGQKFRQTRTSKSGNPQFDDALKAEVERIHQIMPINAGFQYVKANNAFATDDSIVPETKATVWIGLDLVTRLIKSNDGISVAGILAHECAHVFQFFQPSARTYYDQLMELKEAKSTTILVELHADFLAGFYLAKKKGVTHAQIGHFAKTLIEGGSYNFLDRDHHGYPSHRSLSMERGYRAAVQERRSFEQAAQFGVEYVRKLATM